MALDSAVLHGRTVRGDECDPVATKIADYVRHRVTADERWEIERHILACVDCMRLFTEARRTGWRLRGLVPLWLWGGSRLTGRAGNGALPGRSAVRIARNLRLVGAAGAGTLTAVTAVALATSGAAPGPAAVLARVLPSQGAVAAERVLADQHPELGSPSYAAMERADGELSLSDPAPEHADLDGPVRASSGDPETVLQGGGMPFGALMDDGGEEVNVTVPGGVTNVAVIMLPRVSRGSSGQCRSPGWMAPVPWCSGRSTHGSTRTPVG